MFGRFSLYAEIFMFVHLDLFANINRSQVIGYLRRNVQVARLL
jgi:hypothetical protein